MKLVRGRHAETAYADIAHTGAYHIGCVYGVNGNLVARDGEGEVFAESWTDNA